MIWIVIYLVVAYLLGAYATAHHPFLEDPFELGVVWFVSPLWIPFAVAGWVIIKMREVLE